MCRRNNIALAYLFTMFLGTVALSGCGDEQIASIERTGSIQGVWEGTISLSATGSALVQRSRIRLELVQRDFSFDGYLLKIDPLGEGLGGSAVDTFQVTEGTISGGFITFRALDLEGGGALFQGQLSGKTMAGSTKGPDYSGQWSAVFVF